MDVIICYTVNDRYSTYRKKKFGKASSGVVGFYTYNVKLEKTCMIVKCTHMFVLWVKWTIFFYFSSFSNKNSQQQQHENHKKASPWKKRDTFIHSNTNIIKK